MVKKKPWLERMKKNQTAVSWWSMYLAFLFTIIVVVIPVISIVLGMVMIAYSIDLFWGIIFITAGLSLQFWSFASDLIYTRLKKKWKVKG